VAEELTEEGLERGRCVLLGWPGGRSGAGGSGSPGRSGQVLLGLVLLGLGEEVQEVLERVARLDPMPGLLLLLLLLLLAPALLLGDLTLVSCLALLADGVLFDKEKGKEG
jgi:hypothetical protein